MNVRPMKPVFSTVLRMAAMPSRSFVSTASRYSMFSNANTLDVITLFHKPSVPASVRIETLLKQASAASAETATEDQASDHSRQHSVNKRGEFTLDIQEEPPTSDQLKSILEYVGASKASAVVEGASSEGDAMRIFKQSADKFQRPVVIDWSNGKAVVGEDKAAIEKMVRDVPE